MPKDMLLSIKELLDDSYINMRIFSTSWKFPLKVAFIFMLEVKRITIFLICSFNVFVTEIKYIMDNYHHDISTSSLHFSYRPLQYFPQETLTGTVQS